MSSVPDTQMALDAELAGDFETAIGIYDRLLRTTRTQEDSDDDRDDSQDRMDQEGGSESQDDRFRTGLVRGSENHESIRISYTKADRDTWSSRALLCLQELLEWGKLEENIQVLVNQNLDCDISGLRESARAENRSVSSLEHCLLRDPEAREKYLAHHLRCVFQSDELIQEGRLDAFLQEFAALDVNEVGVNGVIRPDTHKHTHI